MLPSPPWLTSPLTLGGFDPFTGAYGFEIPLGDPGAISDAACGLHALSAALDEQARNVHSGARTATSGWTGSAASNFSSYSGQFVHACATNASACDTAATALGSFADDLAHAQTVTRQAQADCQHASAQAATHQAAAQTAGQQAQTASMQAALAPHPAASAELHRQADQAQQAQATAQRAAGAAQTDLENAQRRGQQAYETYAHQAQGVTTRVQAAAGQLRPAPALPGHCPTTTRPAPKHHHSLLGALLPLVATVGLTALDIAQLGLDPATDGLTVITAAETAEAVTTEVAETAVVDSSATAAESTVAADARVAEAEITPRFGSGRGPHSAEVTVTRDGQVVDQRALTSGDMTPEEAALGFPRSSLATHTEARAVRDIPLKAGDQMVIRGKYPPCPSCKGVMNKAAQGSDASIRYEWPGGEWTARGGR